MKKILKIIFTVIFVAALAFEIYELVVNYSDDALIFVILASSFFLFYLFTWIAPKKFFNICWRLSRFYPDTWDYDTAYSKLSTVGLGILITANICLAIGILLTVF